MRFTLLLLILAVTAAPLAADQLSAGWLTDPDQARAAAAASQRLILVDLYADWCGWCKRLEADVFSKPLFQEFARDFVLLRVDTEDGAEGTALMQRFGVYSLPTTLILDERLARVGSVAGYAPAAQLMADIRREIDEHRRLLARVEAVDGLRDPREVRMLAAELYARHDGERAAELYARASEHQDLSPEDRQWMRLRLADSLRIAGRLAQAEGELLRLRETLEDAPEGELDEHLELLEARLARDRGDCRDAADVLTTFLARHSDSRLRDEARRVLHEVEAGGSTCGRMS